MLRWLSNILVANDVADANAKLTEENKSLHLKCFQLQNEITLLQAAKRNAETDPATQRISWESFRDTANNAADEAFKANRLTN